jgi:hypothetical protein
VDSKGALSLVHLPHQVEEDSPMEWHRKVGTYLGVQLQHLQQVAPQTFILEVPNLGLPQLHNRIQVCSSSVQLHSLEVLVEEQPLGPVQCLVLQPLLLMIPMLISL